MNTLNHIAFIMDGNGRWGLRKKKNRNYGHLKGVETVKKIVQASIEYKIPILTFYVFSSENWKRPKTEIPSPSPRLPRQFSQIIPLSSFSCHTSTIVYQFLPRSTTWRTLGAK